MASISFCAIIERRFERKNEKTSEYEGQLEIKEEKRVWVIVQDEKICERVDDD